MKFHLFLVAFASLLIVSCSVSVSQVKLIQADHSLRDSFNIKYQIADCDQLMGYIHPDTLMVSPDIPIKGHFHILVNDISNQPADLPVKYQRLLTRYHLSSKMLPHLSTLFPEYRNVWAYMLGIGERGGG